MRRRKDRQWWNSRLARGEGYTIGIDLGDKRSRYCILDKEGKILRESSVATLPASLKTVFSKLAGCRIAMEVGTHSPWVSRLLTALGHEVQKSSCRNSGRRGTTIHVLGS